MKQFQTRFPYHKLVADETRGTVVFVVGDKNYTVEELVGLIIKHAAENAQRFVGTSLEVGLCKNACIFSSFILNLSLFDV